MAASFHLACTTVFLRFNKTLAVSTKKNAKAHNLAQAVLSDVIVCDCAETKPCGGFGWGDSLQSSFVKRMAFWVFSSFGFQPKKNRFSSGLLFWFKEAVNGTIRHQWKRRSERQEARLFPEEFVPMTLSADHPAARTLERSQKHGRNTFKHLRQQPCAALANGCRKSEKVR